MAQQLHDQHVDVLAMLVVVVVASVVAGRVMAVVVVVVVVVVASMLALAARQRGRVEVDVENGDERLEAVHALHKLALEHLRSLLLLLLLLLTTRHSRCGGRRCGCVWSEAGGERLEVVEEAMSGQRFVEEASEGALATVSRRRRRRRRRWWWWRWCRHRR